MPQPYEGPYIDARCAECDVKLVTQRRWNAASAAEREEMRRDGYAKQGIGPNCDPCARRAYRQENPVTKIRPCMHDDGYPAEPGKRKCRWHLLLKMPMEDQITTAAKRLDAAILTGGGVNYVARARVPLAEWPEGERWCSGCQGFVPLFYVSGSRCKAHAAEASHAGRLEATYGITRADYLALLELQGGRCYSCHQEPKTKRLAVDHDHKTGEVRGLLCADVERGCNHAVVGSLEARSVDGIVPALLRLVDYIENPPYRRLKETTSVLPDRQGRELQDDDGAAGGDGPPADADRDEPSGAAPLPEQPARRPDQDSDVRGGVVDWRDDPDWSF